MRVYCRTPLRQGWVPEPRSVDTVPEVAKAILNLLATGPLTGLAAESLPIFALKGLSRNKVTDLDHVLRGRI